jgi:thiamine biosynthesis lipoprotein
MGTDVHVVAVGGDTAVLLEWAQREIETLDRRWTRFRGDSELSLLNAAAGATAIVPADTFAVVELAVAGWYETDGAFDPTVLGALVAAGYDRSFELVGAGAPVDRMTAAPPPPGCAGIVLDRALRAVLLPPGVTIDLGGVGKGHTADRVASELVARGATGACVNVGGDLRVIGDAPDEAATWHVSVDVVDDGHVDAVVALPPGAGLATSTTRRRRWATADGEAHHVIDPSTGVPATSDVVSATVIAGDTAWAEIVATALLVRGADAAADVLARMGAAALVTTTGGETVALNGFGAYMTVSDSPASEVQP